jgi:hypothetical protein
LIHLPSNSDCKSKKKLTQTADFHKKRTANWLSPSSIEL